MTGKAVPEGALYYASSRRRRVVPITAALRQDVEDTAQAVRRQRGFPPPLTGDAAQQRCKGCSLQERCQPQATAALRPQRGAACSTPRPDARHATAQHPLRHPAGRLAASGQRHPAHRGRARTRLRVPLHHLTAVVCFGHVGLSAPLMHRLPDEGIALVLLDANGRFKARLEGAVSGNVLLRQAQFARGADAAFTLDMARSFVAGKIVKNTRQVLQRGAREAKSEDEAGVLARLADDLAASLRALPESTTLDAVRRRGRRGCAPVFQRPALAASPGSARALLHARPYPPPAARPLQRPAVLVRHVDERLSQRPEAAGLDPQVGFLHALRPGAPRWRWT